MKRVEKQRKPLIFRVGLENGTPSLQVVKEEPVQIPATLEIQPEDGQVDGESFSEEKTMGESKATTETGEVPAGIHDLFINRDGNVTGPFTEKELRRHWANGVIHSEDFVWKEGMAEWVVLGSYFGVPAISTVGTSISGLAKRPLPQTSEEYADGIFSSRLMLPVLFSIISMLCAVFFVAVIPEHKLYFIVACGVTIALGLVVCLMGRKLSLVLLMTLNVLLPVLAWHYLSPNDSEQEQRGNTVEQKDEVLPASTNARQVAAKKV